RDPNLGKVVLYQLSYFRSFLTRHFSKCAAKVLQFFKTTNYFFIFFHLPLKNDCSLPSYAFVVFFLLFCYDPYSCLFNIQKTETLID
ncbi:hypothetical protein, partial [Hoylesella shahii]|uniref:hypothetical protein n=1 Tax=Hoylesella shahii TaxID=228603 RepID=UPI00248DF1F3